MRLLRACGRRGGRTAEVILWEPGRGVNAETIDGDIQFRSVEDEPEAQARRVWDAPVRVFHWSLVTCFIAAWLTRDAPWLDVHAAVGYAMVALLLFRIVWGFVGTTTARFASFLTRPRAAWGYLRATLAHTAPRYLSHNPAGGWSVVVMIVFGLVLSITGAMLMSAQFAIGALGGGVGAAAGLWLRPLHEVLAWSMLALVGLHLAGVVVSSRSHRENLVAAMLTGRKPRVPGSAPAVQRHAALAGGVALMALVTTVGTLWASGWFEIDAAPGAVPPKVLATAAVPEAWRSECASCHLAYPPELLPARSWLRMLGEQGRHFGEDLGLSDDTLEALRGAAAQAESGSRWAGVALRASVPAGQAPQRITETAFWQARHHRVEPGRFKSEAVTGRHDCEACHRDALSAIFSPRQFRNPKRGSP
jgi:cytochrome b